jgi:Cu(I)-responsive transcriptional regulator
MVMNIGEAAARSGLPAKTIRYYGDIGLVDASGRRENGYRDYDEQDLHLLKFVQRARSLGFTVEECRELLDLYRDRSRASADVKALARRRIGDIERKIDELRDMQATLQHLIERCHGDDRPECPILADLAGGEDVHRGENLANQWWPRNVVIPQKDIRVSANINPFFQGSPLGLLETSGC